MTAAIHWRCFHCDDVFTDKSEARAHFGPSEEFTPACQIKASEGGLLRALRRAEADAWTANHNLHMENAEAMRAWSGALARHADAVRSAEETGYEKGLRDARAEIEAAALASPPAAR